MNLALRARDILTGISLTLVDEFDYLLNRINFVWSRGHNQQTGTHKTLVFDPNTTTQLSVGPAGTAEPLPAAPAGYLVVVINNAPVVVPFYQA